MELCFIHRMPKPLPNSMNKHHLNCWFTLHGRALVHRTSAHQRRTLWNFTWSLRRINNEMIVRAKIGRSFDLYVPLSQWCCSFHGLRLFQNVRHLWNLSRKGDSVELIFTSQFVEHAFRTDCFCTLVLSAHTHAHEHTINTPKSSEKFTITFVPCTHINPWRRISRITSGCFPFFSLLLLLVLLLEAHAHLHTFGWVGLCRYCAIMCIIIITHRYQV